MINIFKIIKKFLLLVALLSFLLFSVFIFFLWKLSPDLPSYSELKNYNPSLASRVFTSDGLLLDKYFTQERIFVPINRIPKNLINAFISAEDKKFYKHMGVDFIAIIRAALTNINNKFTNKRMIGASTITQQVVKNLLLSNEMSFERKFKEIILAIRIENILNKDKILELYLNDIYLGYGSYGVASASLNYFNKSLDQLTIDECAFLAALPKAPNNYNPKTKYNNAIQRRNWVLNKMFKNDFINQKQLLNIDKPIITIKRNEVNFQEANYFKEEVRKKLYKLLGNDVLYNEGLIIKTSINTKLQKILDSVLVDGLIRQDKKGKWRGPLNNSSTNIINDKKFLESVANPFPNKWQIQYLVKIKNNTLTVKNRNNVTSKIDLLSVSNQWLSIDDFVKGDIFYTEDLKNEIIIRQVPSVNGAIIAIDPHTGKVLAMSGGFSFALSQFNRATQAKRQPGSAFKPFVYLSAIKEGYTPSTLILDAPYVVDQGPGLPKWKPSNYTDKFYGLSTMRIGIEKSRNLMTIRLSDKIGMSKILDTANDFSLGQYMNDSLSMSLGSGLVTLIDLTNAYAMIANGGKKITPTLIVSVNNKSGKQIINNENKKCLKCNQNFQIINTSLPEITQSSRFVIDPKVAFQITSMLEGVVLRGTGKRISSLGIPVAGKTGTTNDNKDAWFVGYTPDLAIGVYVGFDKPKSLGFKQTGSAVAVPIFKDFIKRGKINNSKIPFRIPSGLSFVRVNPNTGLPTSTSNGILEPFIIGTEPYNNKNIIKLDSLSSINNDSITGTGSLLIEE